MSCRKEIYSEVYDETIQKAFQNALSLELVKSIQQDFAA